MVKSPEGSREGTGWSAPSAEGRLELQTSGLVQGTSVIKLFIGIIYKCSNKLKC